MALSKLAVAVGILAAIVALMITTLSPLDTKPSAQSMTSPYEESLLTDWSDPPPLPVFVVINVLAGFFQSVADALTPPPIRMMNTAFAYKSSRLAHICKEFQIADFLATGPKTVREIADYTQTRDALVVERIMYAMASAGITRLDPRGVGSGLGGKNDYEPRFVNSALSATLRRDHPNSMSGLLGHIVQDGYESFGKIEPLLGPNASDGKIIPWDLVHAQGEDQDRYGGGKLWKFFEDNPVREEQFGRAMRALEGLGGKAMAADVPFRRFDRVIDVGGSLGHFLYKVMNQNNLDGILFDRPPVIAAAKAAWLEEGGPFHDGTTNTRVDFVAGDFFQPDVIPPARDGDVYIMRYILHDWDRDSCLQILSNVHKAMTKDGPKKTTLMIGESAVPDRDTVGPIDVVYKIDMLMMNIFGSALERTPKMWKELLSEASFEFVTIHPTRSAIHFVEAIPIIRQ
jgi:O-methyltransferase domain